MDKSPWWRSGECECWLLWREQGLPHHSPSTERSPILAFTQSQRRIVEIQTLIRNMSSPEESVAPTILSGSRRRSKPRGLSSPLDQLIKPSSNLPRSNKAKQGQTSPNKAKHGQTRFNKVKQGQMKSNGVTCFLRLLVGGGVQCCGLALVVSRPRFALKTPRYSEFSLKLS